MDDAVHIANLIRAEDIALDVHAANRQDALGVLSAMLSQELNVEKQTLLRALAAREQMGSTAIGDGVAVPHARLAELASPRAVFARLRRPIPFDAPDDYPVDLLLALIWPDSDDGAFRASLTRICRVLREPDLPVLLRRQDAAGDVRNLLGPAAASRPSAPAASRAASG